MPRYTAFSRPASTSTTVRHLSGSTFASRYRVVQKHFRSWAVDQLEAWLADRLSLEETGKMRNGKKSTTKISADILLGAKYNICLYEVCLCIGDNHSVEITHMRPIRPNDSTSRRCAVGRRRYRTRLHNRRTCTLFARLPTE